MSATRSLLARSSSSDIGVGSARTGVATKEIAAKSMLSSARRIGTSSRTFRVHCPTHQHKASARTNDGEHLSLHRAAAHRQRRHTVDTLKALSLDNCKFANVVVLSEEKLVAQLDCYDSTDGDKAILNKIAKVDGVVQTNIIAVVRPKKR
jgi:hypothetical protein